MADTVAVLDANVLYPIVLTDTLLRLAEVGLFEPRWSAAINDEWTRNLLADRPDLTPERVARRRRAMEAAFPRAMVTGHEPLIGGLDLPDPDDRHVLAAAIHGGAAEIVTFNLRDFPPDRLAPVGRTATHPDEFITRLARRAEDECAAVFRDLASLATTPLFERLRAVNLPRTAALVLAAGL